MQDRKCFLEWIQKKEDIHNRGMLAKFSEGEIWWIAVGENVGMEINGKNADFSRPAIVFKKLSRFCLWVIPLTSQPHEGSWFVEFEFRGRREYAVLSQIRMVSVARLYNRMGRLSQGDFKRIKIGFRKLLK